MAPGEEVESVLKLGASLHTLEVASSVAAGPEVTSGLASATIASASAAAASAAAAAVSTSASASIASARAEAADDPLSRMSGRAGRPSELGMMYLR